MSEQRIEMNRDELIALFKEKGFTVSIGACSCCQSPWIKIEYENRIFEQENMNATMHPEEERSW